MTQVCTAAATVAAAVALVMVPHISRAVAASAMTTSVVAQASVEPLSPLGSVDESEVVDVIDGVRVVFDTSEHMDLVVTAVEKFARAGWNLTNTEVRFDATACDTAVGFHTMEHGHHVVVMCTDTEWTLLHELGHVWSDLYLDDLERLEWVELQGVDSWSGGAWGERGTERAADIIAFGLHDTLHVPTGIGVRDYWCLVEGFEWLFGTEPLHRRHGDRATSGLAITQRIQVVVPPELLRPDLVAARSW